MNLYDDYLIGNLSVYNTLNDLTKISFEPPTLESIMRMLVRNVKPEPKNMELAEKSHSLIFDFNYPLSIYINKDEFETLILNHFYFDRIGFETYPKFKLKLSVKLNEIMPKYNKLFDAFENWDIFNSGEEILRETKDNSTSNMENTSTSSGSNTTENNYSDAPQNRIQDIKDESYSTEFTYNKANTSANDSSTSIGNNTANGTEKIKRSQADLIRIYEEMSDKINSVYTLIFKDLDELFYQIY